MFSALYFALLNSAVQVGGGLPAAVLTSSGLRQAKELGAELRRKYVNSGFIPPSYDSGVEFQSFNRRRVITSVNLLCMVADQVLLRTSNTNRTVDSLRALLQVLHLQNIAGQITVVNDHLTCPGLFYRVCIPARRPWTVYQLTLVV